MKIIKILVSMTIVNAVFVIVLATYAAKNQAAKDAPVNAQNISTKGQLDTTTVLEKTPDPTTVATATAKPVATKKPSAIKSPTASTAPSSTATPKPTTSATTAPTPTPTTAATTTPTPAASGCIVTVNGASYNIQKLLTSHSGGSSMLKCGSDLTSVFQSRHKTNYSLISKYKI